MNIFKGFERKPIIIEITEFEKHYQILQNIKIGNDYGILETVDLILLQTKNNPPPYDLILYIEIIGDKNILATKIFPLREHITSFHQSGNIFMLELKKLDEFIFLKAEFDNKIKVSAFWLQSDVNQNIEATLLVDAWYQKVE